ncbi:MAG TPA: hypothetical protein VLS89_10925 [Candidatus Nanopelagicales bacterium]|nr:hypothetical protein [Candidatus Nanopelagicales bacterium]
MKRSLALGACAAALLAAAPALAVNKNQSAEFVRTLNRNASTDPDASFFNPAGLAFLPGDGLFVSASNQFIFIDKTVEDRSDLLSRLHPDPYEGKTQALLYPSVHLAYHFVEDFAAYLNFLPIGGGGGGVYEDGIPMFDAMLATTINDQLAPFNAQLTAFNRDLYLEGSAYNLSWSVGFAYRFHKIASVAVGYRLIYAIQDFKGHVKGITVDTSNPAITPIANTTIQNSVGDNEFTLKASGLGSTFIGGLHLRPVDELNIGFRVEGSTVLELENDTTIDGPSEDIRTLFANTSFGDGRRSKITDPVLFGLGVSYLFFDRLKVEANMTYQLSAEVDLDGAEDTRKNSVFAGLAAEYAVLDPLKLSLGYAYDTGDRKPEARTDLDFGTPTHYIAGGGTWTIIPALDLTAGLIYGWKPVAEANTSVAPEGGIQAISETNIDIGVGLTYRLMQ